MLDPDKLLAEAAISVEMHRMVKEGLLDLEEDSSGEPKFVTTDRGWDIWEKETGGKRPPKQTGSAYS